MSITYDFATKQRVYFEDTDALGIVYHANYLKYMERARSEWFWALGLCFDEMAKDNMGFAVHHASLDYHKPARLKDMLLCCCSANTVGKTSITVDQSIINADNPEIIYCSGSIRLVCITLDGRPLRIPPKYLEKLS